MTSICTAIRTALISRAVAAVEDLQVALGDRQLVLGDLLTPRDTVSALDAKPAS